MSPSPYDDDRVPVDPARSWLRFHATTFAVFGVAVLLVAVWVIGW